MRVPKAVGSGAAIGASLGVLFALAVVSFADCVGPNCTYERVVGVLAHAAAGAISGAVLGLMLATLLRLVRRA